MEAQAANRELMASQVKEATEGWAEMGQFPMKEISSAKGAQWANLEIEDIAHTHR